LSFLAEIKRRNVLRIAGLYLVGAWLIVQVASTVLPAFDLPGWVLRAVITLLAIGFIPAVVFAWAFELTPEGLKREQDVDRSEAGALHTGKGLDRILMGVLALALGYFAFDKFVLSPQREAALQRHESEKVAAARKEGRSEALVESYGDKSIAVLPFVNMSADEDQEYFADGIAEELLNLLTKVPQLRVISRSSAFSFKGQNLEIPEIGRRLNVAHVLEGAVRKSGNRVRITAELIDARSDTHLWSETYDRPLDDIFAVQDEIASAVVEQLKIRLLGAAPKAKATDPRAYALFLQGRQLARQRTAVSFTQAISLYQQALAIDPGYAAAWSGLSGVYNSQTNEGLRPIAEGYRLSREAGNKALVLDPDLASAHARLGWIAINYDGDLAAAAQHMERALTLAPDDTDVLRNAAFLALSLGRLDTAIAIGEAETARDPVSGAAHDSLGDTYTFAGHPDAAIASYRTALALSPGYIGAHMSIGFALLQKGEPEAALTEMQKEDTEKLRLLGLSIVYDVLGRKAESDASLADLIRKYEKQWPDGIAMVLAARGQTDRAFDWLDKAAADHEPWLSMIVVLPLFANLHSEPRWLPFLRRIGRAPEQLVAIKFDVKLPQ